MRSLVGELLMMRLEGDEAGAMNARLYRALRGAILDGALDANARLPASRDLAQELRIARNTVIYAYEQLLAEGYLYAQRGSGTFVAPTLPDTCLQIERSQGGSGPRASGPVLSARGQALAENALAAARQWGAFLPGVPDIAAFPHRKFGRIVGALWRNPDPALLSYAHGGGWLPLRRAVAEHLAVTRSIDCEPEQILLTEGTHQALDIVLRMLGEPGDIAWMENPGYWGARAIFGANGLRTEFLPVDEEGMCLPSTMPQPAPRLIFVTPSHQYPLGSVMSLARRRQLLALARQSGSWIIEDDYDSEFRFAGRPIAALLGLETNAPVIYLGTFSKTLYPGLRMGYLVLPRELVPAFQRAHAELYRGGSLIMQAAMATFMRDGHYVAHIRRMRLLYAQRRAMLSDLIARHLGTSWLHPYGSEAGLHLVLNLPHDVSDTCVVQLAQQAGVLAQPLSRYYADPAQGRQGLLLGFAGVEESQMAASFGVLVQAIRDAGASVPLTQSTDGR